MRYAVEMSKVAARHSCGNERIRSEVMSKVSQLVRSHLNL